MGLSEQGFLFSFDIGGLSLKAISILYACKRGGVVHSGQVGVWIGAAAVVLPGPAQVVRRAPLARIPDHAASAAVDDPPAEQVGAFSLGMRIDGPIGS
ncbi:hypothetical protein AB0N89_19895 [Amycolatopsis sp. NPDC089917]|uniref:hypothetical protein n=1 Tax=Amycolatopsis sp. NPDC089917 TaxID=3155187 RepID=UPI003429DCED